MNTIKIDSRHTKEGMKIVSEGKEYNLRYPKDFWSDYKDKSFLHENLTSILTISSPVVARKKEIIYNTSKPLFFSQYHDIIEKGLPSSNEDYRMPTKKAMEAFRKIKYLFSDDNGKNSEFDESLNKRAIVALSFGKDSLLTLAVGKEIGLDPVGVYVNDTVSPNENNSKRMLMKKVEKMFSVKTFEITNEIEKLNDFETWNTPESCVGYAHMITGFCLLNLPIAAKMNAKYLLIGSQRDLDNSFVNKEGFKLFPEYDQTAECQEKHDRIVREITNNQARVTSIIRPLSSLAIMKILSSRYGEYANLQHSCDCLDGTKEDRWCHYCNKCARLSLFMHAFGINPEKLGFHRSMLNKGDMKYYALFKGSKIDGDDKSKWSRDEQLLAFYLAYKQGVKGYLIDEFRKEFYDEAVEREDELHKEYLTAHNCNLPKEINNDVMSIYKEELSR
jgi:7-cyano-7-deazaguanine synthase in queuosine biosynthesis